MGLTRKRKTLASAANSVRAEYLADMFDTLPAEKQDAVMGMLEAMSNSRTVKATLPLPHDLKHEALAKVDIQFPARLREAANQLI